MRWMWIDRIIELVPRQRLVAIKSISLSEDHLHAHFPADERDPALPIMPASLIIEGMAQSAGILVGHAGHFKQKVILAKVNAAELTRDATPGTTLRYTAELDRYDTTGAATKGTIELIEWPAGSPSPPSDPRPPTITTIGRIDLMFSHLDQNMTATPFPEHNFVFSEAFRTLLRTSGIDAW